MQEDITSQNDKELRLPVGLCLVADYLNEQVLLQVANSWSTAFDWRKAYMTAQ